MVAINTQALHQVQQIQGSFTDATAAIVAGEENEALALTVSDATNPVDWTYSATAENPGSTGDMDGQPGLIYNGPSGICAHVLINGLDILEGTIAGEENDSVGVAVFLNNTFQFGSDEGLQRDVDTETAVEFNGDGVIYTIQETDVIRIGIYSTTEETINFDNTEGSGEWSIS